MSILKYIAFWLLSFFVSDKPAAITEAETLPLTQATANRSYMRFSHRPKQQFSRKKLIARRKANKLARRARRINRA